MTSRLEDSDALGQSSGATASPGLPGAALRSRVPGRYDKKEDQTTTTDSPLPSPSLARIYLRDILRRIMILDIQAAHTLTEDMTREQKLQNLMPHFRDLWNYWPLPERLLEWMESKELYQHDNIRKLPYFDDLIRSLSDEQVLAIVDTRKASPFYFRLIIGRMSRYKRQKMIYNLANKDLAVSCDINLGLVEEERTSNEAEYLGRLTQKQHEEKDKLSRVLEDAVLLRDSISSSFEQGALSHDLLLSLRSRISSLHENYYDARELLDDERNTVLLDHTCEAWFVHRQSLGESDTESAREDGTNRRWKTRVTLAFLTFLFALMIWWPTYLSLRGALDSPGLTSDGNFWGLVVAAMLQVLGLITQLFGPMVAALLRQAVRAPNTEFVVVVRLLALSVVLVTILSLVVYVMISVQFGLFLGVVSQLMMVLLQLLLYFRD
ncbi:hypothetical protein GQ53DRAFT_835190 [Thozetella sp. PMI_491]|nr:hypothetical protein GQ53DRAFT_835190 [Thozetella sp. PMI_491]